MLDAFRIDDGRHLLQLVIDEDASRIAGTARYRTECSCNRLPVQPAGSRDEALAAHLAHVTSKIGPSKGPAWLPLGARVALLLVAMLLIWGASYATGLALADHQDLTGTAATTVTVVAHLSGLTIAFGLMVAVRRYIAPTCA